MPLQFASPAMTADVGDAARDGVDVAVGVRVGALVLDGAAVATTDAV
jgi:hypothetical protein